MRSDHDDPCISMQSLSDEAAAEILDFLQSLTNDFENRYSNQIRRYYNQRSRQNISQDYPTESTDDPPF